MKFGSSRMILGIIPIVAACFIGSAFARGQARGQAAPAERPQMADDVFKNIQVLKGIPVDEFMDTMGMFAASLSFNCVDCHTLQSVGTWDHFADDTPLKQTTRKMIQMVNTINKDNFSGVRSVTCYTCHHGDLRPKIVPELAAQYAAYMDNPNEPTLLPASAGPTVDQVFAKYMQALGGAQRVASLTSYTGKGTFIGFETEQTKVPVDVFAKSPNQKAMVVHTALGDSTRTFDGRAAWIASPDRPVGLLTLTGGNLDGARIDAVVTFPAQLRQAFNQWRVGATSIDDKEVQVLQGSNPRQPPVNFYFDQAGLLVRILRYVDTAVGRVPTQIDYSDYRDVAGVKVPFKWVTTWTDGQATTELTEVQPNPNIPATRFARPAPIRPK
ncbi:MAG TPA: photosynthetic reaction center cytochrome c subunit family protein [Terriglobia bacterium]|nr:photosynthetic reaction center cytochrome c subunit family protein [Terriglobia bacterium]